MQALGNGSLPAVSFVKPIGEKNEHPGYTDLVQGQKYVKHLVEAIQSSRYWKDTAIIISPYAKKGFVDHTLYDITAILKFIVLRWDLQPLGTRDANANNLLNAFDFTQTP